jgi:hypothetical protein
VETIDDPHLRTQVACTIWWDYFGGRETKDAWPHLDRHLAAYTKKIDIEPAGHRAALIWCGYTAKLTEERVKERPVGNNSARQY